MVFLMQPSILLVAFATRANYWLMVNLLSIQTTKSLSDSQLVRTQHILVLGAVPPQGQGFALPFVDLQEILVGLFLQPAMVSLNDCTLTWCICHSYHL